MYKNLIVFVSVLLGSGFVQADDPMNTKKCQNEALLTEIKFLEKFVPDMESGKKTATTRRGIRCVKAGQKLVATTPKGQPLGQLMVLRAYMLRFNEITTELAKAENTTIEGLQNGLISIYGPDIKNQDLTAIHFIWVE